MTPIYVCGTVQNVSYMDSLMLRRGSLAAVFRVYRPFDKIVNKFIKLQENLPLLQGAFLQALKASLIFISYS